MARKSKTPKFYVGEIIRDAGRNETYTVLERVGTSYKCREVTTGEIWSIEINKQTEKYYELIQPTEERLWS